MLPQALADIRAPSRSLRCIKYAAPKAAEARSQAIKNAKIK